MANELHSLHDHSYKLKCQDNGTSHPAGSSILARVWVTRVLSLHSAVHTSPAQWASTSVPSQSIIAASGIVLAW